jgi:hypothetical protein
MGIDVGEIVDPSAAGAEPWWTEASHLDYDEDRLRHQCPAALRTPEAFANAKLTDGGIVRCVADGNAPAVLAAVHVNGNQAAKGWLEQWQSARSGQVADVANEVICPPLKVSRLVNSYDEGQAVGPNREYASFGIDGSTGPIGTPDDTWNLDGAALGGRRVQWAVAPAPPCAAPESSL